MAKRKGILSRLAAMFSKPAKPQKLLEYDPSAEGKGHKRKK